MRDEPSATTADPRHTRRGASRSRIAKILALAVSTAIALILCELAVRLYCAEEIDSQLQRRKIETRHQMAGIAEPSHDPGLLFELKRNYYYGWIDVLVATNADSPTRFATFHPPPADPAFRIALLGDSTSFGHGLQYESSYAAVLRVMLEEKLGIPIELRNYSVPTYNSAQERILFEREVLPWNPDLVILHYDHNDASPPTTDPYTMIPPEFGENALHSAFFKFARRKMRRFRLEITHKLAERRDAALAQFTEPISPDTGPFRYSGPRYDRHLDEIRRIGEGARRAGIPAVAMINDWGLTPHDDPADDPHFSLLHPALLELLDDSGFLILDSYPRLQALMKNSGWKDMKPFWLDGWDVAHPNESGHFFFAQQLYDFILNQPSLRAALEEAAVKRPPSGTVSKRAALTRHYQRGLIELQQGRFDDAEKSLRAALPGDPNDAGLRYFLAQTLQRKGDPAATAELEYAVRLKPDFAAANFALATQYRSEGRRQKALQHFAAVLNLRTGDDEAIAAAHPAAELLVELANTAAGNGKLDTAKDLVTQAAMLYRKIGEPGKAAHLEAELQKFPRQKP